MKELKFGLALALSCAAFGTARAEISGDVVRVGVLNDISATPKITTPVGPGL
jgi:branched-chain amino acid transport system substrate-binding protein